MDTQSKENSIYYGDNYKINSNHFGYEHNDEHLNDENWDIRNLSIPVVPSSDISKDIQYPYEEDWDTENSIIPMDSLSNISEYTPCPYERESLRQFEVSVKKHNEIFDLIMERSHCIYNNSNNSLELYNIFNIEYDKYCKTHPCHYK